MCQEPIVANEQAVFSAIEAEKVVVFQTEVWPLAAAQYTADLMAAAGAAIAASMSKALNSLYEGSLAQLMTMSTPSPVVLQVLNTASLHTPSSHRSARPNESWLRPMPVRMPLPVCACPGCVWCAGRDARVAGIGRTPPAALARSSEM